MVGVLSKQYPPLMCLVALYSLAYSTHWYSHATRAITFITCCHDSLSLCIPYTFCEPAICDMTTTLTAALALQDGTVGELIDEDKYELNSPLITGVIVKRGLQGQLTDEASKMTPMRHPGIVNVYAVLHDAGTKIDRDALGWSWRRCAALFPQ